MIEPSSARHERLGWLECLISSYQQEHDWAEDDDPSATHECLRECKALLDELLVELGSESSGGLADVAQVGVPRPVGDDKIPF